MTRPPQQPRRCVVTGANRGLGLEFTRQLLARGDRVVATCRHPGKAQALNRLAGEHPGRLHVLPLDVAEPKSVAQLARELPLLAGLDGEDDGARIDLLINNAGVLHSGERFGQVPAANLDDSLRSNATGPFLLTQALAPLLVDGDTTRRGATVANLSSGWGSIGLLEAFRTPSYAISKAALNMATALLAHGLRDRGITVLALNPGWVRTDMGGSDADLGADEAVAALLAVIDASTLADSGRFLDRRGGTVAW
ncbi:SDR family oxidoreductase [Montanilutibacter psychrotolerans]|uniref:SDR family oxidoreductase n=1 Tax=Montanilutibacter psychrotolerans TaxID=1327343 RepID=A0A3M8SWJ9_9GAMM|nr:SDR family oxidoreductase [Lysobacter psychrotolerans]RNF83584.1 SDR family oxidoreductase [Lysobacter psychrotolerans]